MRRTTSRYSKRYNPDTPIVYLCVLIGVAICWINSFVLSTGYPVFGEVTAPPLWNAICLLLPGKAFTYLFGLLLMLGGAFLLHRVNFALMLIREKTLTPILLFILFISTNPDFVPLKSTSLGVFCLILAIYQLFTSYHDGQAVKKSFNAAFIISLGSLLWVHILWFLPLFWIGMYQFRSLSLRTLGASLFGVATVYWFVFAWCVWQEDYTMFTIPFTTFVQLNFLQIRGTNIADWVVIAYMIGITALSAVHIITRDYEDSLRSRQFLSFLCLFAIWSFTLFLLYEQSSEEFLQIFCLPAAILNAHYFVSVQTKYTFWLLLFTIFLFVTLYFVRLWNF